MATTEQKKKLLKAKIAVALRDELGRVIPHPTLDLPITDRLIDPPSDARSALLRTLILVRSCAT
jgi:hypothetical protein